MVIPPHYQEFRSVPVEGRVAQAGDPGVQLVIAACNRLDDIGLVDSYPSGGSNGNVSYRINGNSFLITGTQLATKRDLSPDDFTIVHGYDNEKKEVPYTGKVKPSSETIFHSFYIVKFPIIEGIVHGHVDAKLLYPDYRDGHRDRIYEDAKRELGIVESRRSGRAGTLDLPLSVDEVMQERGPESWRNYTFVWKDHFPGEIEPESERRIGMSIMDTSLEGALQRAERFVYGLKDAQTRRFPGATPTS